MKKCNQMKMWAVLLLVTAMTLLTACNKKEEILPDTGEIQTEDSVSDAGIAESPEVPIEVEPEETVQMFSFKDVYGQVYEVPLNEEADMHDYTKYIYEQEHAEGRYLAYDDDKYTSRLGIDVSKFQGEIDWAKVKEAGIEFVFVRIGNRGYGQEGTLNTDPLYMQNIAGAKAVGIDVGVYFYSQAINETEAIEEANYVLSLLDGMELDYPVVFDEEYVIEAEARTDGIEAEQFTKNTIAFCETIAAAGYEPMIYATMKWEAYALEMEKLNQYEKWYADYEPYPQTPYDFRIWQYTAEGYVDGVTGPVDLNLEFVPIEERADEILQSMTLEEKVAQLFVITPEALTGTANVQSAGDATKTALQQYPVGGIIYFAGNMVEREQTIQMLQTTELYGDTLLKVPLFLAVDEEGGTVARVANNPAMGVPNVGDMAAVGAAEEVYSVAYEAGETIGNYLNELGFNLNFAPVADVLTNPDNQVVAKRSFGSNPERVSIQSFEYLRGLREYEIMGVYKHFPGHGATLGDTHEGYAYTDKTLDELKESDLMPFMDGANNQVPMIMSGHISLPNVTGDDLPASLSKPMITDILKNDLGYEGVVITDALNMGAIANTYTSGEACIMAIEAGNDMLLMPADFYSAYAEVLQAVKDGRISEARINQSVKNILKIKLKYI